MMRSCWKTLSWIGPGRQTPIFSFCALVVALSALVGCAQTPRVGEESKRRGDEIVVAGRFFHTGAPVVLWTDPGGYDAYRVERRFVPWENASWDKSKDALRGPNRFDLRASGLTPEEIERFRGGGWDLESLRGVVDQFVLHYDVCGTSRTCFRVLHDMRRLSVHFLIDIDGTIYQTLDVKERAWHATISNTRSVGVEIAHMGAYKPGDQKTLSKWYAQDELGNVRITIPPDKGDGGVRTPGFIGRPLVNELIAGEVHGQQLEQPDFTPEQYESLARLTAALHAALPKIRLEAPRDENGRVLTRALTEEEWRNFSGLLGHFHVQEDKIDPGPALRWDLILDRARAHLQGREPPPLRPEVRTSPAPAVPRS
mgnify:CR=1 FL=1